jgi:hypothetical protein
MAKRKSQPTGQRGVDEDTFDRPLRRPSRTKPIDASRPAAPPMPDSPPCARATFGPQQPVVRPFGAERLRRLMRLSRDVPVDRLCEDASAEIERLRERERPHRWLDL